MISKLVDLVFEFAAPAPFLLQIFFQTHNLFVHLCDLFLVTVARFFIETIRLASLRQIVLEDLDLGFKHADGVLLRGDLGLRFNQSLKVAIFFELLELF